MKVDNPLSREFIVRYPFEAAQVLEQVHPDNVAALFSQLSSEIVIPVIVTMLPTTAAACLEMMEVAPAAKLLTGLPVSRAARIFSLLSLSKKKELAGHFSKSTRSRIYRLLEYAPLSAGDLMDPSVIALPEELTVDDTIRRIGYLSSAVSCDIYLVDKANQLKGVIELGRLMRQDRHTRLRDIMTRKIQPVFANMQAEKLLSHPGWMTRKALPVVDRDNTLIGVLDYTRVREAMTVDMVSPHDPMQNLLSLAGLYWLSMTQLLDSLLSVSPTSKGRQR